VAAKAPDKPNGQPCNKNAQCRSRHCCTVAGQNPGRCRECCSTEDCPEPACQTCTPSGTCQPTHEGETCDGDKRCCRGKCRQCCTAEDCGDPDCHVCTPSGTCRQAREGDPCDGDKVCCQGQCRECCHDGDCGPARVCRDHVCLPDPGACTAGQNLCHDGTAPCDDRPGCQCVSTTSGATFCGLGSRCSDCSRDEDCTEVTGPGSVCADFTGDFCSCRETNRRACLSPCDRCTSDQQCSAHQRCCDGECQDCCTTADCRGDETCEGGRCVCRGCRSRINNTCVAGTAWTECGTDGARCAACARGEVCAADRQSCVNCESIFDSPAARTWCDAVNDFAEFQCEPNCVCAALKDGRSGVCFGGPSYCTRHEPICTFPSDCVIDGFGTDCLQVGNCEQASHCKQTVCVTKCGAGPWGKDTSPDDGPPRIVVLDRDARP
jgi:hypothetical protein